MTDAQWTHRATWPKDPETHETDRVVTCDGIQVARVTAQGYPKEGTWKWNAGWRGHVGGECGSLKDALADVKQRLTEELARYRGALEAMREDQARVERYRKAWDERHGFKD